MTQVPGASFRVSPPANAMDVHWWPIIEWSAHRIQQISLVHLASHCDEAATGPDCAGQRGSTLWCGLVASGLVGVSWSWQQIAPGVLVIADPLAIRSNLRWLGDDGHVLGTIAAAALHTRLVVQLRWEQPVRDAARSDDPAPVVSWPAQLLARC